MLLQDLVPFLNFKRSRSPIQVTDNRGILRKYKGPNCKYSNRSMSRLPHSLSNYTVSSGLYLLQVWVPLLHRARGWRDCEDYSELHDGYVYVFGSGFENLEFD